MRQKKPARKADLESVDPIDSIDIEALKEDLQALKNEIDSNLSKKDYQHLKKIERWGKMCTASGYLTSWLFPNLLSAFLISQGNITRWCMMAHHVCHRGYDKIPGIPKKYTSKFFAKGKRRFLDWFDWILPEAWSYEHNVLHHYYTSELSDPDLVENNTHLIRKAKVPKALKYLGVLFFMLTWKYTYYAPNTLWIHQETEKQKKQRGKKSDDMMKNLKPGYYPGLKVALPITKRGLEFWSKSIFPYALTRFGIIPALFMPLGPLASMNVFANSVLAELITNIHSFLIIVTNHAGSDLYRFDEHSTNKAEFYFRQIITSVNFKGGSDLKDFLQGWLNYQIEHHLWPDLPMSKYQEYHKRVKAICKKHGVPYIEESVFKRFKKLLDIAVNNSSMKRMKSVQSVPKTA